MKRNSQRIRERRATDPAFRAARNAAVARWKAKPGSRAKVFARYIRRTYGLTLDQYEGMLQAQGGCCAICRSPSPGGEPKGWFRHWQVDHDHATGKVRGILCHSCNRGLGGFRDNTVALRNAISYLDISRGG